MSGLERLAAKTDFNDERQMLNVKKEFEDVVSLLNSHAEHECSTSFIKGMEHA